MWDVVVGVALERASGSSPQSQSAGTPLLPASPAGASVKGAGLGAAPASAVCPLLLASAEAQSARTLCQVANGFARVGVRDERLLQELGSLAYSLDASAISATGVAQLLHALGACLAV